MSQQKLIRSGNSAALAPASGARRLINLKDREDRVPSVMILLAILLLLATLAYMVFVTFIAPPSGYGMAKNSILKVKSYKDQIKQSKLSEAQAKAAVAPRLWVGGADTVSAAVLAQMTQLARQHSVVLNAFRPQRAQDLQGITEMPYIAQISGTYPGIHALMASLDAPNSKVALSSFQVTSAEATDNRVAATLGLSTFVATDPTLILDGSSTATARSASTAAAKPAHAARSHHA